MPILSLAQMGSITELVHSSEITVPADVLKSWNNIWNEVYERAKWKYDTEPGFKSSDPVIQQRIILENMNLIPKPDGWLYWGSYDYYIQKRIEDYQQKQGAKAMDATIADADTLMAQAKRAVGQMNLEHYGYILKNFGGILSSDEKQTLSDALIDWQIQPKSESHHAAVEQVFSKLKASGYNWKPSQVVQDKIQEVHLNAGGDSSQAANEYAMLTKQLEDTGEISPLDRAFMDSYEGIKESVKTAVQEAQSKEVKMSNGLNYISNNQALTASDWEGAAANQQLVTDTRDIQRVSPLETAFLRAGNEIKDDISSLTQSKNQNIWLYAGLAFVAFKLLKR